MSLKVENTIESIDVLPWRAHSPGEFIRIEILDLQKMSQGELAKRIGVSRRTINELVGDRRGVSTDMALRLSMLTGQTAEFWLRLQMNYELWKIRQSKTEYQIEPLAKG